MSHCPFCNRDPERASPIPPSGLLRRAWKGAHWLVPSMLLVFMPKCPMCVIAYFALFTGIGISITAAHWIQILLWTLCLLSFTYLVITRISLFQRSK